MRRDIEQIIFKLAHLKDRGLVDLALTTNGYFLPHRAESLKQAGLDRITISLDSLKRDVFEQMTGVDVLDRVLLESERRSLRACNRSRSTPSSCAVTTKTKSRTSRRLRASMTSVCASSNSCRSIP